MRHRETAAGIIVAIALLGGLASAQSDTSSATPAATTRQEIEQLQQQLKALEEKEKAAAAASATNPSVTADEHGFTIKSADGDFLLNIGADIQVDNRSFFGVGSQSLPDTILLRRARPVLQGTVYKYVDYFFRPDFGKGQVLIYDAYAELKYFPRAKLRAGKFKPPVGMERLQSDDDTTFVERGFPTLLVPQRDIGFQLSGDIVTGRLTYAVGVFNGVADNGLADVAVSNHRDYAARIFLTPFQPDAGKLLRGLGLGIGASGGNVDGEVLPAYSTFGQNTFFNFSSGVIEAGHRTRLQPQLYYYLGGFGFLSEYGIAEEGLQRETLRTDAGFRAWQTAASWILTGEKKGFRTATPKRAFDPKNGGWGEWEIAFRIGGFSAAPAVFSDGFASTATSPRDARERVMGVNWYLNRLFRISLDYGDTGFGGGSASSPGGNRPVERVLIVRFQLNFVGS